MKCIRAPRPTCGNSSAWIRRVGFLRVWTGSGAHSRGQHPELAGMIGA